MSLDHIKQQVGEKAASFIHQGMVVGLGTGTTAFYFIQKLAQRCQEGLKIQAVASSEHSRKLAEKQGIPLIDVNHITSIDITVDGADEIDEKKQMIKGGGGALVREKIVASMSRELVIIIDETKLVSKLGKRKLPVEIIPFGYTSTRHKLEKLGYSGHFRKNSDGSFYLTDNHNYILDIDFKELRDQPQRDHEVMIHVPGVVDTGFFFDLAGRVVIGFSDGQIVVRP